MHKKLLVGLVLTVAGTVLGAVPGQAADVSTRATAAAMTPSPDWPPAPPAQLVIDTAGVAVNREDYVPGTVTLDGVTHLTGVRGRGNSTWTWAKKPYKLELEEDAALVGDVAHDEWVLLAGYADRSAMRTAVAFAIAAQTRLDWTPRFRFVDVVLNGQSQGLYMLTEQVEEGEGRVELPDNGYLLEVNQRFLRDDEAGFRSGHDVPVSFKDPDEVTKKQRLEVRRAVRRFERVLYGSDFADPETGYAKYVNVKKLIDWYLVEELFRNQDSNFQSSVNFSWIPGRKFVFGPVWDFDISTGTRWKSQATPEGWLTRVGDHWLARMFEDPAFSERVKSRWSTLRPIVDQVVAGLPSAAAPLSSSAEADWALWHTTGDLDWTHHARSWTGEVQHVGAYLSARARWLSRNEVRFASTRVATGERARTAWVPVELQVPATAEVSVAYEIVGNTATAGTDFVATAGRIDFAAGEQLRYVPVQILDDDEREKRETVLVRLPGQTAGGIVVGSPDVAKVGIAGND